VTVGDIEPRYLIQALQQELARLSDNRIVLMAQIAQQEDAIATMAAELSKSKGADDADPA
jgi:cell division protein FtsB